MGKSLQLFLRVVFAAAVPISVIAQAYPPNGSAIPTVAPTGRATIQEPPPNPPNQQSQWNMELGGHLDLQGRSAYKTRIHFDRATNGIARTDVTWSDILLESRLSCRRPISF